MLPLKKYLSKPMLICQGLLMKFNFLFPDKMYLRLMYRIKMGRSLNLKHPKRFSEKLQWLKLYDRKSIYTQMVDKITAKEYVANLIGEKYIIPTLGVWDHFDDINFDTLPDKFVLKTNHSGGGSGVVLCHDKSKLNKGQAKQKLEKSLKNNVYKKLREWPYKDIKPRIFAEELVEDFGSHGLLDYKIFCCNGIPKMIKVNYDVATDYKVGWYTLDWEPISGTTIYDPVDTTIKLSRPDELDQLLALSKKLSENTKYLRVDFYCTQGKILFGELTFFPGSGFEPFVPDSFDYEIGSWIDL